MKNKEKNKKKTDTEEKVLIRSEDSERFKHRSAEK